MPASRPEEFRLQFRTIRERRGLTQVALGQRAGMAPASISHFETGTARAVARIPRETR